MYSNKGCLHSDKAENLVITQCPRPDVSVVPVWNSKPGIFLKSQSWPSVHYGRSKRLGPDVSEEWWWLSWDANSVAGLISTTEDEKQTRLFLRLPLSSELPPEGPSMFRRSSQFN